MKIMNNMKVKQLIAILKKLNPEAIIDIASDEEGNSFGDISRDIGDGFLVTGERAYSLYPKNSQSPEERYQEEK